MSDTTPTHEDIIGDLFQSNKVYIRVLDDGVQVVPTLPVSDPLDFPLGSQCDLGDTECESCS